MPRPHLRILLALALAGAALTATLVLIAVVARPTGSVTAGSLEFEGVSHQYRLFVPTGVAAGSAAGLLVVLHGYTWDAQGFESYTGLDAQAARLHLLAVYPQGFARSWNAGSCCGEAARRGLDDVGFVGALVGDLQSRLGIRYRPTYAAGFSNGAMLALRIVCEQPALFRAVVAVAGELERGDCASGPPVSTLLVHGSADQVVRFPGLVTSTGTSVFDWALRRDGCRTSATAVVDSSVTRLSALGCPAAVAVDEYELAGTAHEWPRGTPVAATRLAGDFLAELH
jgi:polyhydroxybutyrate depolymerase